MRQECLKVYIMKLNQYMICIDNVTIQNIGNAMYKPSMYIWIIVYTCLSHVYTEIQISVLVYAIRKHVQNMFVPCLYLDIPTQASSYMLQTAQSTLSTCFACNKKSIIAGLEPSTLCIPASCLNHYTTRLLMEFLFSPDF